LTPNSDFVIFRTQKIQKRSKSGLFIPTEEESLVVTSVGPAVESDLIEPNCEIWIIPKTAIQLNSEDGAVYAVREENIIAVKLPELL